MYQLLIRQACQANVAQILEQFPPVALIAPRQVARRLSLCKQPPLAHSFHPDLIERDVPVLGLPHPSGDAAPLLADVRLCTRICAGLMKCQMHSPGSLAFHYRLIRVNWV